MVELMGFLIFIALCFFIFSFIYIIEEEILPEIRKIVDALETIVDNKQKNGNS